jgi:hypothetical protein
MIFKNIPIEVIMLLLHYEDQPANTVDGINSVYCESCYEYRVFKMYGFLMLMVHIVTAAL